MLVWLPPRNRGYKRIVHINFQGRHAMVLAGCDIMNRQ